MNKKATQLRFREINRDIFEAIKNGKKKIETRAATVRFRRIKKGDYILLICAKEKFIRQVKNVQIAKNIDELISKHKIQDINPGFTNKEQLRKLYYSFPDYEHKIEKFGMVVIEFVD